MIESIAKGVLRRLYSAHMPKRFRTATEFQERGKCLELFPGGSLDDGGGFPGLSVDVKAMLSSFPHELVALTLKMSN